MSAFAIQNTRRGGGWIAVHKPPGGKRTQRACPTEDAAQELVDQWKAEDALLPMITGTAGSLLTLQRIEEQLRRIADQLERLADQGEQQ